MDSVTLDEYLQLCSSASLLEGDEHGYKVLLLEDGRILKLFRRKRLLSSAAWSPYAERFSSNCKALALRGFTVPIVDRVFRQQELGRDGVLYQPVKGQSLRQVLGSSQGTEAGAEVLIFRLEQLVEQLVAAGVFFRSLHMGNVIVTDQGDFGLIDLSDIRFFGARLERGIEQKMRTRLLDLSLPHEQRLLRAFANQDVLHDQELKV